MFLLPEDETLTRNAALSGHGAQVGPGSQKLCLSEHVHGCGVSCTPGEPLELVLPSPAGKGVRSSWTSAAECRDELEAPREAPL